LFRHLIKCGKENAICLRDKENKVCFPFREEAHGPYGLKSQTTLLRG